MAFKIFHPEMLAAQKMTRRISIYSFLCKINQKGSCYRRIEHADLTAEQLRIRNQFDRKSFVIAFMQHDGIVMFCRNDNGLMKRVRNHSHDEIFFHANLAHQFPDLFVYDIYLVCEYRPKRFTKPPRV